MHDAGRTTRRSERVTSLALKNLRTPVGRPSCPVTKFRRLTRDFVHGRSTGYGISWLFLSMFSFAILLRSVVAWRFRILAAPLGPSITPSVRFKAARMWLRSICSRLGKGASADGVGSGVIG